MKKIWIIMIGVVAFTLVLGIGAVAGGAVAYFFLRDDIPAVFASPGEVESDEGVIISHVDDNSPASKAGLVRGDILLKIGGQDTNNLGDLMSALKKHGPGDMVELMVLHGDDLKTLSAVLGDQGGVAYLGISTCLGTMGGDMILEGGPLQFDREVVIIKDKGAYITEVVDGSPAENASLEVGDTILSLNGEEIGPDTDLADLIVEHKPGDIVKLVILRAGEEQEIEVELGENPDKTGQAYLGVYYSLTMPRIHIDKDGEWRYFFDDKLPLPFKYFDEEGGLPFFHEEFPGFRKFEDFPEGVENAIIVGNVTEGEPADKAGLQVGDLIIYIDGEPVESLEAFVADIQSRNPGDKVDLTIFRNGEEIKISATLGEHPDDPTNGYLGVILSGFVKMSSDGEKPGEFEFDLEKELKLPGGDA